MRAEIRFEPMECRECGETIVPSAQIGRTASSPSASIYVCSCGFRYSNNRDPAARTAFAPTPEQNVPERFRSELTATLDTALNKTNLRSKLSKFTYSTSEDAVTWTIFRWLQEDGALGIIAEAIGIPPPDSAPEVLFWGAPVGGQRTALAEQLRSVCLETDGNRDRLTEPDIVIAWPTDVFFVEVKYRARNEHKPGYKNFPLYTTGPGANGLFAPEPALAADAGWYELTRNWRIGAQLAHERGAAFTLVNLGPAKLGTEASGFEATVARSADRGFAFLSWGQLLKEVRGRIAVPADVEDFVQRRDLESRWA